MKETRAVLWDMDGTLIDSEEFHWIAWRDAMADEGIAITRACEPVHTRVRAPRPLVRQSRRVIGRRFRLRVILAVARMTRSFRIARPITSAA